MHINFSEVLSAKYFEKYITVKCIISGKSEIPYSVPKKVKIKCPKKDKYCKGDSCTFNNDADSIIEISHKHILQFVSTSSQRFHTVLKQIYKLPCKFKFEVVSVQNVERIFIAAPTGKERSDTNNYICYYLGYGISSNTTYELSGYSTTDPLTQEATCVFVEADKLKSDVDTFSLTKTLKNQLNEFVVNRPSVDNIYGFLETLYKYYARNVTKIYDRFALHLSVDLVFRSVISFKFDNEKVHKGWIDAAIIGDTRCGKGYVAENLVRYFNVGEVVSGDNASYSGLVGGVDSYNGHRVISWGKIPLNDLGLLIIDEAGEIKSEDWTRLSRVRSEGLAEIVKIRKRVTNARTRLLSLLNPALKTISAYSYGIQAIMDVIKAPEDIARFDYVTVVSHDEVSVDAINKSRPEVSRMFSSELEQELILWAWSRKVNQVQFSDEAVKLTYEKAIALAKIYSFSIPLIQGENVRIKLAKLAVCFAARTFSNKLNGKILYVDDVHIDCAFGFLNMIYQQEHCGYYAMSKLQRTIDIGANKEDIARIDKYFKTFGVVKIKLCKCLLNNNSITVQDLAEQINVTREIGHELISKMIDLNLISKRYHGTYIKNPAFTSWLKKIILKELN